ncbi:MAG: hypothetical protein QW161_06570 [Candidatus Bathyarchaeia archaeon]
MSEKSRKATKKVQEKEAKKPLPNKKLLIISITLAVIIILGAAIYQFFWQASESEVKFPLKTSIVDQLGKSFPIQSFRENITSLLVNQNFTVVYNGSEEITVEFFKGLPKSNCGLYLLRAHSAVRNNTNIIDFFTNEPYQGGKYEEYGERLGIGWYLQDPNKKYFVIGPGFVEIMDGKFPKSIIIAMGCKSLKYTTMAQAFLNKGAQLYIGWTDDVDAYDSDKIIFLLLELLFNEGKTISDAIRECNRIPRQYPGELDYFPKDAGKKRISELICVSIKAYNIFDFRGQIFIAAVIKSGNLKRAD